VSPRRIAYKSLRAADRGAWAADFLYVAAAPLSPRDAALAEQITLGVLRYQSQLDFLIQHFSGRSRLDPEVRTALRMGIYQLRYLDRIPAHAAVAESVDLVKRARKASAAGFVNAVLRKVTRDPIPWPDRATALSHPAWLIDRWISQFGEASAIAIAQANLQPPATYIRVPPPAQPPPAAEPCPELPGCYRVPARATAGFRIQDIGSQSIVPLLDLHPGQTFLDLCAAPGNKTAQALESGVKAVACDVHLSRLKSLEALPVDRVVLDGAQPLPFRRKFDRILLDAPCSGTGTLARNPEIKWRLTEADLPQLQARQRLLLANALDLLSPGGRLVYSTCSLEPEENEDVVKPYNVSRSFHRIPGRDRGDGFFAAMLK
jgi:16S rRNA (cytosine967-C5)-methyltransferase